MRRRSKPALPIEVELKVSARSSRKEVLRIVQGSLENPNPTLAFLVRVRATRGFGGEEVLPVLWDDNYFSLLPRKKREVTATLEEDLLGEASPGIHLSGWNVVQKSTAARP
jgi:exo-1,4-beta-D-glucosaminidase